MEISQPSIGIFYISKVLALAPYATVRNSKGRVEIGRSWLFTVYSATLTVVMVFLTYRGLLFDANSEIPVRSFGIAVLFILVSCLLHLVATAYFLFLELLSKRDNGYLWVQMLWICFHFLRLLMVVEPCHLAARESRKTIQIVCEIERKVHEPILAEAVKKFWQQLLVVDADFSACGLCRVNRTILTSFASAIATYLVILIQFQRTNG